MIRPAAVAGQFYPAEPLQLRSMIHNLLPQPSEKSRALAFMAPHAGYIYSGRVAASVYGSLHLPSRFILLGPRHFPRGERFAVLSEGAWETPLGRVDVDTALASEIKNAFPLLREDAVAHAREHSLEVQLPFLQCLVPNFTFVPIVLGADRFDALESLGRAIAQVLSKHRDEIMLLVSSDMNHYESDAITRVKDRKAIDAILSLDARRLYDTVRLESISMCGYAPAVAMLAAARELHAAEAKLISYATSAEVSGDYERVVGYAGIIVQ
ncbi:MAG TPA: AmmeMemoRadiSam system protein B [Candidatus Acidoferrales bacterium]|nr:AmmeMemoRadiSam system protein B [Candidatus Acidoferrales bacterium]